MAFSARRSLFFALAVFLLPKMIAAECVTSLSEHSLTFASEFNFSAVGGGAEGATALEGAVAIWQQCSEYDSSFPGMTIGGTGGTSIEVRFYEGLGSTCGQFLGDYDSNGQMTGGVIEVWSHVLSGSCEPWSNLVAHEVGHALGLSNSECSSGGGQNYLMGGLYWSTDSPHPDECAEADDNYFTDSESVGGTGDPNCDTGDGPIDDDSGDPDDPGGCCNTRCSPIVLDLAGKSLRLSGPEPPVQFDIDDDGVLEEIAWTRANSDEAFLALDRNGNGTIDGGAELFGAATRQPPSSDPNGFEALAMYDDPKHGGNADGVLSIGDSIFGRLVLWSDRDRNGQSEPWELYSLAERGIKSISLDYFISERRDRYGNRFRWAGRAEMVDGRPVAAVDVIFGTAAN